MKTIQKDETMKTTVKVMANAITTSIKSLYAEDMGEGIVRDLAVYLKRVKTSLTIMRILPKEAKLLAELVDELEMGLNKPLTEEEKDRLSSICSHPGCYNYACTGYVFCTTCLHGVPERADAGLVALKKRHEEINP